MRILVGDDDEERCNSIIRSIRVGVDAAPEPLPGDSFTEQLNDFYESVSKCLKDPANYPPFPELKFDGVDILVLDNNLAGLDIKGARLTAESIIGHIRLFTSALYIVSLNKNSDVDFDLKFLVGDHETRADIALNTKHLTNPGLWDRKRRDAKDRFLPWYWPQLNEAANVRRAQIEFVLEHLNDFVLATLGFSPQDIGFLSRHAAGALSSPQSDPERNTFRQVFIDNERSPISIEERKAIDEAESAMPDGARKRFLRQIIARDVAARIDLWFRRDVVSPQEPLVDIPHMLIRFPFFLGKRAKNVREWNKSVSSDDEPHGLDPTLYARHLDKAKFDQKIWLPNPCFRWAMLKADEQLSEFFFSAKEGDWADVVFCEDRSEFLERTPADGDPPLEFPAEFQGSWTHRYVSRIEGYQYSPRMQLTR